MIEFNESIIDKLIFHKISTNGNLSIVNNKLYKYKNEEEENILKNIFLKPFISQITTYEFNHEIDLNLNILFQLSKSIYDDEDFIEKSKDIFTHLKTVSKHPNIKDGDLFIVKYEDILFNNGYYEALGIYKIENKENFIEIDSNKNLIFKKGISNKKLDKACLILFANKPYTIFIIDNANKDTEYWKDEFINVKLKNDFINNTTQSLQLTRDFIKEELSQQSKNSKVDQAALLNKSVQFFKEKDNFNMGEFANEVMEQPEVIERFNQYKSVWQQEHEIDIPDDFTISDSAVKKQARIFKSVIKLDKNFHIYVHGNSDL
ncbi:MAG: nucleoid-associated protein, partial [Bacteroidales bacterium]|nr:nucleoid-associated protein [Bacteroidales bacterium]